MELTNDQNSRGQGDFFYGIRLRKTCETNHQLGCELMRRMVRFIIERLQVARRQLLVGRRPRKQESEPIS
ncbi:MAG: hypothetical protein JWM16_6435 [Verrucomicrobiales bacterium]|nr:hypothetical protein [Verrucomicrobiales bacterium]